MRGCSVHAEYMPLAASRGRVSSHTHALPRRQRGVDRLHMKSPRQLGVQICRGGAGENTGTIRYVNEEELEVEIINREKPLIIDFYATWCGPCVMLSKELEQVAEALGDRVQILKIDCDENEGISSALQIQGLPTLVFVSMDPEKPALRTEGLLPAQSIIDIVNNEM